MGNLFGKREANPSGGAGISEHDRAVLELKRQRDRLKKYQLQIGKVIERETEVAKELLRRKDKKRALLTLRKKKYQEQCLEKAENKLFNLEQLVNTIEFAKLELDVFQALDQGKEALQAINEQMKIEDVEKMMEDTAEALAYQEELDALLGTQLDQGDEDAILDELAAIEEEQLAGAVEDLQVPATPMADAPSEQEQEREQEQAKEGTKAAVGEATRAMVMA